MGTASQTSPAGAEASPAEAGLETLDLDALREWKQVFERFIVCEFTTLGPAGEPVTWPVTPYYAGLRGEISIATGLGYPRKADNAAADPRVSLLFSDPLGSGLADPPTVLVQGWATVDDQDLDANARRYARESLAKLPATKSIQPPAFLHRFFDWYFTRIYIHVRPLRVIAWGPGEGASQRTVVGELPPAPERQTTAPKTAPRPDADRLRQMRARYRTAVLSWLDSDAWPVSARVPYEVDAARTAVLLPASADADFLSGPACLTGHSHAPDMTWQRNVQARGALRPSGDRWELGVERVVGGFEVPQGGVVRRSLTNARKATRFRRIAARERARRAARERSLR